MDGELLEGMLGATGAGAALLRQHSQQGAPSPDGDDAASPPPPTNIVDLIPDLVWVEYIVLFLELREIGRLACCCKTLRELLMQEPFVWQQIAEVQKKATLGQGYETYLNPLRSNEIDDWRRVVLLSNQKLVTGDGAGVAAASQAAASTSSIPGDVVVEPPEHPPSAGEAAGAPATSATTQNKPPVTYTQHYIDGIIADLESDESGMETARSAVGSSSSSSSSFQDASAGPTKRLRTEAGAADSTTAGAASSSAPARPRQLPDAAAGVDSMELRRSSGAVAPSSSSRAGQQSCGAVPTSSTTPTSSTLPVSSTNVRRKIRVREEVMQRTQLDDLDDYAAAHFFGGHAPHLHWLEGTRLLAFAGNFYRDRIGGATPLTLPFVYELDCASTPPALVATINYGRERATDPWPCGEPHPQIMGAASAVWRGKVVFFGGGSPIDATKINNCVTQFCIRDRKWEAKFRPGGGVAGESYPKPRQGQRGTVFEDKLFIFGGRELTSRRNGLGEDNGCRNDLWTFDLCLDAWASEVATGEIPAPRVWYSSCESTNGRWLVCGGSLWDFKQPEDAQQIRSYQDLFCLHLRDRRWERISIDASPAVPPWVTAGSLVATGREILFFGGTKPQNIGADGITVHALMDDDLATGWPGWYGHVAREAHVFDATERRWKPCDFDVSCDEFALRRSHFAAAFVPPVGQIFVFGGSRYFTGEYFHDLVTLDLPHSTAIEKADANAGSRTHPGEMWTRWKGQIGRLKGMWRVGELNRRQMEQTFVGLRNMRDEEDEDEAELQEDEEN